MTTMERLDKILDWLWDTASDEEKATNVGRKLDFAYGRLAEIAKAARNWQSDPTLNTSTGTLQ